MYDLLKLEAREVGREKPAHVLRKEGHVPGVIFGKGMESLPFQVPMKNFTKFMNNSHSKVFEVEVGTGKHLVSLENIQRDHFGTRYMHIELQKLQKGQATTVTLPIKMVGESPAAEREEGVVSLYVHEMDVKGLPKDLVDHIEIDISALEVNDSIHLSEIKPPHGLSWVEDGELVLAHCAPPRKEEVEEPEETEEVEAKAESEAEGTDSSEEGSDTEKSEEESKKSDNEAS
jgi:large subunit ribosomal protein L25